MEIFGFELTYYQLPMVILALVGIYIFYRMWIYITKQLKESKKRGEKQGKLLSRITFATMMTTGILFIIGLVVSSLMINIIFGIQERKLIFIDAMIKPWQFADILRALFVVLLVFIGGYPLLEMIMLAGKDSETPTNFHRWIKNHFFRSRIAALNYFTAIFVAVVFIFGPPAIISYILLGMDFNNNFELKFSNNTLIGFVFTAFLVILPILYLAYYSNISKASYIKLSRKIAKAETSKGKRIGTKILMVVAILVLLSQIYSLVKNLPMIWGSYPELTTSYADTEHGLIATVIESIIVMGGATAAELQQFYYFRSIFPIDFLLFVITTVLFGFTGFYWSYMSKKSINKSQIMWFSSYLIAGLALEIFMNILMQWPWVLPDFGIFELADPVHQQILVSFFGPTTVVINILVISVFLYHIFFNKSLSKLIEEDLIKLNINRDRKIQDKNLKQKRENEDKELKKLRVKEDKVLKGASKSKIKEIQKARKIEDKEIAKNRTSEDKDLVKARSTKDKEVDKEIKEEKINKEQEG